jgi:hypothetical protein
MSGHDHLERAARVRDDLLETAAQLRAWGDFIRSFDPEQALLSGEEEAVLFQASDILQRIADGVAEHGVQAYDDEQEGGRA